MQTTGGFESLVPFLYPDGLVGRVAVFALAWTTVAALCHLLAAMVLLVRFRRAGPVVPMLLPQLEQKWAAASFRTAIWRWLRLVGLVALFVCVLVTLADLGLFVHSLLAAPIVGPDWQRDLGRHLDQTLAATLLWGLGLAVRSVVGGIAALLVLRARTFVSASRSLVSHEEVERARRYLDGVDVTGPGDTDR